MPGSAGLVAQLVSEPGTQQGLQETVKESSLAPCLARPSLRLAPGARVHAEAQDEIADGESQKDMREVVSRWHKSEGKSTALCHDENQSIPDASAPLGRVLGIGEDGRHYGRGCFRRRSSGRRERGHAERGV